MKRNKKQEQKRPEQYIVAVDGTNKLFHGFVKGKSETDLSNKVELLQAQGLQPYGKTFKCTMFEWGNYKCQ